MYVACKKIRKKTEGKQKKSEKQRNDFFKKNNKCSISSRLRQGLYTFFWSQKFEFLMYLKIRDFLEEKNILI